MIQGSDEWHLARLGKVTASRISDVMMKPSAAGYQNYMAELVCERLTGNPTETFQSAAMAHGNETEPQARAMYELITATDVDEVGFVEHPQIAMAGASPDGLIGADGGLEIKCPQQNKHMKNLTGAKIDRGYMLQMQWNMACTGRFWWDFVSFNSSFPEHLQCHIQRVSRDPDAVVEITKAVTDFISECDRLFEVLMKKSEAAA